MLKDSNGLTVPLIRLIIEHGSAIKDSVGFWGYLLVRQKKKIRQPVSTLILQPKYIGVGP